MGGACSSPGPWGDGQLVLLARSGGLGMGYSWLRVLPVELVAISSEKEGRSLRCPGRCSSGAPPPGAAFNYRRVPRALGSRTEGR